MVEKRFDLLTVESYNKVIKRCKELISESKFDEIEKEFGYPTNAVWETSGDFLNPNSSDSETLDILHFSINEYTDKDAYLYLTGDDKKRSFTIAIIVSLFFLYHCFIKHILHIYEL